jgi:hypothetical protein
MRHAQTLRSAVKRLLQTSIPVPPPMPLGIVEITPYSPRESLGTAPRLNLILPSINAQHYFGGIHTAVLLYRALCVHYPRSRIILADSVPDEQALGRFPDHSLVDCEATSDASRQIVPYSDRYNRSVGVESGDIWLATAWWTAYAAQRLANWQLERHGRAGEVMYLVQDFEPGFYPWSSQFAVALSTYRPNHDIAIFNTQTLADYFALQGLTYQRQLSFEPTLNAEMRRRLEDTVPAISPRQRRVVIYGRPSTPRNAFELICEGLRAWGSRYAEARQWDIVAPGEISGDIDLGPVRIRGVGKLDIGAYAELLSTSAIGISLMVSPHPSYPPLEMAAFGMHVLTNGFANKNLAQFSENITSVPAMEPDALAATLVRACEQAKAREMRPLSCMNGQHPFLGGGDFASLATKLAAMTQPSERAAA